MATRVPAGPTSTSSPAVLAFLAVLILLAVFAPTATAAEAPADACPSGAVASQGFADVLSADPHGEAVDCVAWWSIAHGTTSTSYQPGKAVNRGQMATFVTRLMSAGGYSFPDSPPDAFSDDDGNPHEDAIDQLAAVGIVSGTGPGRYSPDASVSREQMATFLVRAHAATTGIETTATTDHFADDGGSAHEDNINIAATLGIASGKSATSYDPGGAVLRNQMATFVARVLNLFVQADLAQPPASSFGDGTWTVPDQMPPGLYRNSDSSQTCLWERRVVGADGNEQIVASELSDGIMIVRVKPTDASFHSLDCGTWTPDLSPRTTATTSDFGAGHYQVGNEVAPGTWRNSDSTLLCEWRRLSGFSGEDADVIDSDFEFDVVEVTIEAGDAGFYSEDCGTWTFVAPPVTDGPDDDAPGGGGGGGGAGGGEDGGEDGGGGGGTGGGEAGSCFGCVTLTSVAMTVVRVPGSSIPSRCIGTGTVTWPGGQVIGPNVTGAARTFTYGITFSVGSGGECDVVYDVTVGITTGGPIRIAAVWPARDFTVTPGTTNGVDVTFSVPDGNFYEGQLVWYVAVG